MPLDEVSITSSKMNLYFTLRITAHKPDWRSLVFWGCNCSLKGFFNTFFERCPSGNNNWTSFSSIIKLIQFKFSYLLKSCCWNNLISCRKLHVTGTAMAILMCKPAINKFEEAWCFLSYLSLCCLDFMSNRLNCEET